MSRPVTTPASAVAVEPATAPAVDQRALRNTFGTFATGVTVVTCRNDEGVPHGATVNAFTAVSLDPPLAQVTLTRTARAAKYLQGAPFAINILAIDQLDVALHFAGRPMNGEPRWEPDGDVPVLCGNAGTLECTPWHVYDGGDHIIVIGEVVKMATSDKAPLLFHRGKFRHVGDLVDGSPWDLSGDSHACGWYSGAGFRPMN